jgi:hypothetical protein
VKEKVCWRLTCFQGQTMVWSVSNLPNGVNFWVPVCPCLLPPPSFPPPASRLPTPASPPPPASRLPPPASTSHLPPQPLPPPPG